MSKLHAALAWAARGFRVFPLVENGKEPVYSGSWFLHATTDADAIRSMWTDPVLGTELGYNIGADCTDRVVVDIDEKWYTDGRTGERRKKDGIAQYHSLGGTYDTLVVKTPSGGYHCYFEGPDSANTNIAQDIEIRSHHGYVVAPGSTIDGVPYEIVTDRDPAWIPFPVEKLLRAPDIRTEYEDLGLGDSPANIQAGINYLQSTDVAIEGQRGDETTFITAARLVRELSLSPQVAFELMRDYWNERCIPPWSLDELLAKVENAYNYGTAEVGRLDPAVTFAGVHIEPPPSVFDQSGLTWGNAIMPASIRPRPWLVDRVLMRENVTVIAAAGSGGKSSLGLVLAAHLAEGRDFGEHKTHGRCKTIVYNGEDDIEEQSRRLLAVCHEYGFDYSTVRQNVMLLSEEQVNMTLVSQGSHGAAIPNEVIVNAVVGLCADPDVGLLILDPLVDVHTCNENDSAQMNVVIRVMKDIGRRTNTAVLTMHHTGKAGGEKQEARVGNMDILRGSSSIVYKARASFTLLNASSQDAENYGMQEAERSSWARLDDAKMNITLANENPMWFRKTGVRIMSGDVVGVLKHQNLTRSANHIRMRVADLLITTMVAGNSGSLTMQQAIGVLRAGEPLMANQKDTELRQKLETFFLSPITVREHTLQVVREPSRDGRSDKVSVRMT